MFDPPTSTPTRFSSISNSQRRRPSLSLSLSSNNLSSLRLAPPSYNRNQSGSVTPTRSGTGSPIRSRPGSSLSTFRPQTPLSSYANYSAPQYIGTINVAIRPKPTVPGAAGNDRWYVDSSLNVIAYPDIGEFLYDHVLDPAVTNAQVYTSCVQPIIQKVMSGFNGTVFAYGMTSSGKTWSMQGSDEHPGVIPLSIAEIFGHIVRDATKEYKVCVSYLEIYNEKLIDLLALDTAAGATSAPDLKIRDDAVLGVRVVGLQEVPVSSQTELMRIIKRGDQARKTSATDFNAHSSRSHAVVLLRITCRADGKETFSTLSLCDLAGSEKATAQQERRKEGSFINKSLLTLSNVISKLSSSVSAGHIPYRESKLTRLLQPALSGDSLVCVLCTIQTTINAKAETVNTLRFAARAKNVVLHAMKNESAVADPEATARIIQTLTALVEKQKSEIAGLRSGRSVSPSGFSGGADVAELKAENRILTERVEHLVRIEELDRAEHIIVKNDVLNFLTTLRHSAGEDDRTSELMIKLEEIFTKQARHVDESKSYIKHLENQLYRSETLRHRQEEETQPAPLPMQPPRTPNRFRALVSDPSEAIVTINEQAEELTSLRDQLKDKERIIKALKSSNMLRDSLQPKLLNYKGVTRLAMAGIPDLKSETKDYPMSEDQENISPM
ncbi:hypothetical protein BABINDRAFT_163251 [Babjeviella inositovora NRRL Y-12698]|uniref:Kinesin-like protein n=1 Tax=Babjeviella inositovora NRRL Y-12698 TaxID=984486 RepID=A0A1E3QJL0_9ASCO|nr:uncharacterized protein BABINDRAFT_163251 [Babjeviella inositovora NRRL Y-12698]ODQ77876.1 hypothetical protein BABINDRAFT_163251 [Babjeviella inositovora NRRL Y-12698]